MRVSRLFFLLSSCAISCIFLQCSRNYPSFPAEQKISINIVTEPQTLDPRKVRSLSDITLVKMLGEGLVRRNKNGSIENALAESYSVSEDKKTYTFTLKKDIRWSSGHRITAQDFLYAWRCSLSPKFPSDNAFLLFAIKNAKQIKEGSLPIDTLGCFAPSDNLLIVELERPLPYFLKLIDHPIFFPIDKEYEKTVPRWTAEASTFVSNGPFKLDEWEHNNHIVLKKNPTYWDAASVRLKKIKMLMVSTDTGLNLFQNNELHWDGSTFSSVPTDLLDSCYQADVLPSLFARGMVNVSPLLGTFWMRVNVAYPPFTKKQIRKALALAINRKEIVKHVIQGGQIPALGLVPPSIRLQDEPYFQDGDLTTAKTLLEEYLREEKKDLDDLPEFVITYSKTDKRADLIARSIRKQWQEGLGLRIRLKAVEKKCCFDKISKQQFQLACGSWIADFDDPISFLQVFESKKVGTNNTSWDSPDYFSAIQKSYLYSEESDRRNELRKAEEILLEEMPIIPLFHFVMLSLQNPHLRDVIYSECGSVDFRWAYLDQHK